MTETVSSNDLCEKCNKPKRQLRNMTLTQWMFSTQACNCDSGDFGNCQSDQTDQSTSIVEICSACGLPVLHGRQGSMTQWIFGAGSCKCAASQFQDPAPEMSHGVREFKTFEKFEVSKDISELTTELGLPADRYQVLRKVGEGASAKVYECQDRILRRLVAIKLLTSGNTSSGEAIRKFQAEAKATSKLSHANIVTVHDFGATSHGQPYMVLEYFTGVSLATLLSIKGPLPEGVAAEIGAQVASAMAAAHQKEIVHRDLKPANIMLVETDDDVVVAKVIDFGIAEFNVDQSLTAAGHSVCGTPDYMSPDQLRGKSSDPSSDIYSLGCTLFEAMTGRPPFVANSSLAVIQMHLNQQAPLLNEVFPSGKFSQRMENLIASMLEKNLADRISTMEQVHDQLREICVATKAQFDSDTEPSGDHVPSQHLDTAVGTRPASQFTLAIVISSVALLAIFAMVSFSTLKQEATPVKKTMRPDVSDLDTSIKTLGIPEATRNDSMLKQYEHKTNVTRISIRSSSITDAGLDSITHLPLVTLTLPETEITDTGFKKICQIKTLLRLNLCQTPKIRDYSNIKQLSKLQSLYLTENQLTDKDLDNFKTLTDLRTVNLSINPFTGTGLSNFKNAKLLSDLKIGSAQFTTAGVKALAQLDQVTRLSIRNSNLEDPQLETIATMPNLKTLDISGTKITDTGLLKLAHMKGLKDLRVGGCQYVTPRGIAELRRLRKDIAISTPPQYDL